MLMRTRYNKTTRKVSPICKIFAILSEVRQSAGNQNAKVKQLIFRFSSLRSRLEDWESATDVCHDYLVVPVENTNHFKFCY